MTLLPVRMEPRAILLSWITAAHAQMATREMTVNSVSYTTCNSLLRDFSHVAFGLAPLSDTMTEAK